MTTTATEDWTKPHSAYDLHAVAPERLTLEWGPRNTKIARFEVRPGDKFKTSSGERSEIVLDTWRDTSKFRVLGNEGTEYYRVSVKLDAGWQAPERNVYSQLWGCLLQCHGPNEFGAPPAIALHAEDKFGLFILGGDMTKKRGGMVALSNGDLAVGKWVEFVFAVRWSALLDGQVALYRRDEGRSVWEKVADVSNVPTLQWSGSPVIKPHYWKAGFYRSESPHVTNTLHLGKIVRAKTMSAATARMSAVS